MVHFCPKFLVNFFYHGILHCLPYNLNLILKLLEKKDLLRVQYVRKVLKTSTVVKKLERTQKKRKEWQNKIEEKNRN